MRARGLRWPRARRGGAHARTVPSPSPHILFGSAAAEERAGCASLAERLATAVHPTRRAGTPATSAYGSTSSVTIAPWKRGLWGAHERAGRSATLDAWGVNADTARAGRAFRYAAGSSVGGRAAPFCLPRTGPSDAVASDTAELRCNTAVTSAKMNPQPVKYKACQLWSNVRLPTIVTAA